MTPEHGSAYSRRVAEALHDRYDIERVIGRGGMSIVYLARDRHLGREVAIKVLDPEACSAVGAERFLREVRITAPLQHPNILPLIDSGTVGDIVYSVMPFVEGESLRDRLVREGPLPVEEALLTAREVADALDYAHKRGIVHRDIKPENILISNGKAVVADFGIARASSLANELTLSGSGLPIGTPAYMSPEQVRGRDPVDARADVYSLGCTLYEMLAGQPPFDAPSVTEVLSMHLEQEPAAIERRRPELSDRVVEIVGRAMQKRPADRFQSGGEMAAELRAVLGEPARHPTPPGAPGAPRAPSSRPSPSFRPERASGWLVFGAIGLSVAALVLLARQPDPALVPPPAEASLAVLPFTAEPPGSVEDYLTEGLAGEIHANLSRHGSLRLTAPASALAMAGPGRPMTRIGDTLGVNYLLTGTTTPAPGGFRAVARLVRAGDASTIWQRTYEVSESRVAEVAGEIAAQAAAELVAGTPAPVRAGARASSARFEDAMLRGRYWIARSTPEAFARARDAFETAVAIDSTAAMALAGLSRTHARTVMYAYRGADDLYTELAKARKLALRAVAADPADPEARLALARASYFSGMPPDSAEPLFDSVLAASPNIPEALIDLAHLNARRGRTDSALALARRAMALDPLSAPIRHGAITAALRVRRADLALEWARARLAQDPGDRIALALESYALPIAGRAAECAERDFGPWLAAQATCLHAAGRPAEGRAVADSLASMLEREEYATAHQFTDLATYHAWNGRARESLRWLERAAAHTPLLLDWAFTSGLFDPVAQDPAFRAGLERVRQQTLDRLRASEGRVGGER